jgi:error-prone DNA polymerase
MGFYAPSQLVQDAGRHGVEVRPADALESEWECTLELAETPGSGPARQPQPAIRLGLLMVKGLSCAGAERLVAARTERCFADVEELAFRAALSRRDLAALAKAGALHGLAGHRRLARWEVLGTDPDPPPLLRGSFAPGKTPDLPCPTEGEELAADYAALGLSLGRHPIALLRDRLARRGILSAARLNELPHGCKARAAGLVITRQRPGTASGVTFVTLEDETGTANVVVWRDLAERQRKELFASRLLAVSGKVEREGRVVHLVARRLTDESRLLGALATRSRDFR